MTSLYNVFLLFLILLNSTSLGKCFFKKHFSDIPMFEFHLLSCCMGLFTLSYFMFFIGITALLYKTIAYILLGSMTIVFVKENIATLKYMQDTLRHQTANLPIAFFICAFFVTLILSLSPSTYWDELQYHLTLPKLYLLNNKIGEIPEIFYSHFPQTMENLFLFAMMLSDDTLANGIHWSMGILCSLAVYVMARKFYNKETAVLSATLFFTTPCVLTLSTLAYVDLGTSLYSILSFYAILLWDRTKDKRYFFLSGIFCGIALSIKHNAYVGFILMNILIMKNFSSITAWEYGLFLATTFAAPIPYYLKSYYFTGNPVYPFFYSVFGGENLTPALAKKLTISILDFGRLGKGWEEFILFPWNITVFHRKFWGISSPVFLSFVPLLAFFRKEKITKWLLFLGTGYLYFFFFLSQQIRFFIPSFAIFSILSSRALFKIKGKFRVSYRFSMGAIVLFLLFSLAFIIHSSYFRFHAALGLQSREKFLEEYLDIYPACKYVNEKLPPDSKVFFINDNRVYYCNKKFLIFSPANDFLLSVAAEERYAYLRKERVTHILYVTPWFQGFKSNAALDILLHDLKRGRIKPVFEKNDVNLFELNPNP